MADQPTTTAQDIAENTRLLHLTLRSRSQQTLLINKEYAEEKAAPRLEELRAELVELLTNASPEEAADGIIQTITQLSK